MSAKKISEAARKPVTWVLFSKSGFSMKKSEGLLLFDTERLGRS